MYNGCLIVKILYINTGTGTWQRQACDLQGIQFVCPFVWKDAGPHVILTKLDLRSMLATAGKGLLVATISWNIIAGYSVTIKNSMLCYFICMININCLHKKPMSAYIYIYIYMYIYM